MKLVVFGLSVSSSWGNGHATTYRALLSAFARRGHDVVFFEWDAPWYREHRDLPRPDFCELVLYDRWEGVRDQALAEARDAHAVLVGSYVARGAQVVDELCDAGVSPSFYDIDTPVTVAQLRSGACEFLRRDQVPLFQRYLSFTGGPFLQRVVVGELGARAAFPLYCSVDLERYQPATPDARFAADLAYMGTYAPDRQEGVATLLLEPARRRPAGRFLVAGPQYPERVGWPRSVRHLEHVGPPDHAAFYSSADWQLNLTRADMRSAGWSPSVRLFEAAACGAAMISDRWDGIDAFFEPGAEILLPEGPEHVLAILEDTHPDDRRSIGAAARARVVGEHSAEQRALELETVLSGDSPARVQRLGVRGLSVGEEGALERVDAAEALRGRFFTDLDRLAFAIEVEASAALDSGDEEAALRLEDRRLGVRLAQRLVAGVHADEVDLRIQRARAAYDELTDQRAE